MIQPRLSEDDVPNGPHKGDQDDRAGDGKGCDHDRNFMTAMARALMRVHEDGPKERIRWVTVGSPRLSEGGAIRGWIG